MEVQFHRLRPDQIRERREACPVLYIPLGTLEWHGLHNPMGADGLQAEEMARRCAELGGGLVFPTVYYGESRVGSLLETDPRLKEGVAERLGLSPSLFGEDRFPVSSYEQIRHYQQHLLQILAEAASYGFRLAVFIVGHYPLLDHARAALLSYNQWQYDKTWPKMNVWAASDFTLLKDRYNPCGDHAGGWETSHLLASAPDLVDLSLAEKEFQYGVLSVRDPAEATAEFGNELYDAFAQAVVHEVEKRMQQFDAYHGHGLPL